MRPSLDSIQRLASVISAWKVVKSRSDKVKITTFSRPLKAREVVIGNIFGRKIEIGGGMILRLVVKLFLRPRSVERDR